MLKTSVPPYYKSRRDQLIAQHPGAVFLLPAAQEYLRNDDVHHAFRQESNFYYLTGFDEPESFLVIAPAKGAGKSHTTLFVRKRDAEREMWDGARYGIDGARAVFGADEAFLIDELDQRLPELLSGAEKVFYKMGGAHGAVNESMDRRILAALETARLKFGRSGRGYPAIEDPKSAIGEMRLFKSSAEIEILSKACSITARAHNAAMREVRPGMNEFEIEALVDYEMRRQGCQRMGYGSIVAGGVNAACLHYRANNEILRDGELLLVDAGGEYDYFTSDITRTYPIGRGFKPAQARIYDLVLSSQKAALAAIKPGAKLPDIHRTATEVLTEGMLSLGFLKGDRDELIKAGAQRKFFPHGTSHWLGMDVHDAGLYQKDGSPRLLEPGMCFTVEPGFYVQPTDEKDVPAEYHHIGVRIEDDIVVTKTGCDVLTKECLKERADVEGLKK